MKSKRHHPFLILAAGIISLLIISCREQGETDGGPCSYRINKLPATIIAIENRDSATAEILFETETNGKKDTLYYTRTFVGWATPDLIARYDLQVGNRFVYEEHQITKGTCNPHFYRLTLEKFK
jgi:hypothetical protein